MTIGLTVLLAAVVFALAASLAFSRLSGVSAVSAMAYAIAAIIGLTLVVFLAFTVLTSQFE